jgi:hypothetical protein
MELLFLILNNKEYLDKALRALDKIDITGVTVYDSESLGQFIGETPPGASGAVPPIGMRMSSSKTITAIIQDGVTFNAIRNNLIENGINLQKGGVGEMLTMPIGAYAGPGEHQEHS